MKKVLVMCIAVSFIATACDWFKRPTDTTVITTVDDQDSTSTVNDTSAMKKDNTMVVNDSTKNAGKRI